MNPLAINLVAVLALTGALIDNFSWGVALPLVGCVLLFAAAIVSAKRQQAALAAAAAEAEELLKRAGGQG